MMTACLGCGDGLPTGSVRSMCAKCRAYIGRWRKRPIGEITKRQKNITLCARRLGIMKDVPKKGDIEVIDRERKGKVVMLSSRRKSA